MYSNQSAGTIANSTKRSVGKSMSRKNRVVLQQLAKQVDPKSNLVSYHKRRNRAVWQTPDGEIVTTRLS